MTGKHNYEPGSVAPAGHHVCCSFHSYKRHWAMKLVILFPSDSTHWHTASSCNLPLLLLLHQQTVLHQHCRNPPTRKHTHAQTHYPTCRYSEEVMWSTHVLQQTHSTTVSTHVHNFSNYQVPSPLHFIARVSADPSSSEHDSKAIRWR